MKIGVLGGSFNPVHNGHIHMAIRAKEALQLEKVILMVDRVPPHKQLSQGATNEDRLSMVRLACANEPGLEESDWELRQPGPSYTALTLAYLAKEYPDDELFFIMGSDMLRSLPTWFHPEKICRLASLVCICRAGQDGGETDDAEKVRRLYNARVTLLPPLMPLSSTEIRDRLRSCKPIFDLVPAEVERYIYAHALYMDEPFPSLTAAMERTLKPERFAHVVGVMKTAVALADRLGESGYKARLAALLHDCAKNLPLPVQQELAQKDGSALVPTEASAILHAPAGAYLAKNTYGVTDESILQAIRYHTTGEADMTLLDEIIWAADVIEPGRTQPRAAEYRNLLLSARDVPAFEQGLLLVFQDNICYIQSSGRAIHPATLRARNALYQKYECKGEQHGAIE